MAAHTLIASSGVPPPINAALYLAFDVAGFAVMERSAMTDEMARDEARHGKAFEGLLKRYFNK